MPLFTMLGAGLAIVLSLLGILELTLAENIIVALLGLLAFDALTERLNVLEKIEAKLDYSSRESALKSRQEYIPLPERAEHAMEICILAISATTITAPNLGFYQNKLKSGCGIRVILLDPDSPSLEIWALQNKSTSTDLDIRSALETFRWLIQMSDAKGVCQLRLAEVFPPFSMVATDLQKDTGEIIVEFYTYKSALDDRPHVALNAVDDPYWYNHYKQQFEQMWANATPWIPDPEPISSQPSQLND